MCWEQLRAELYSGLLHELSATRRLVCFVYFNKAFIFAVVSSRAEFSLANFQQVVATRQRAYKTATSGSMGVVAMPNSQV